jgi:membrane-anchored protein YejM (alkaline phosphatase superfamily)
LAAFRFVEPEDEANILVVSLKPVFQHKTWLNAYAFLKAYSKVVIEAVFHPLMSWLKAYAKEKAPIKEVTASVCHPPMSWLKELANLNVLVNVLTASVYHPLMSWLKASDL